MEHVHDFDEPAGDAVRITTSGAFLCEQVADGLSYIYRRVEHGAVHPLVSTREYEGWLYSLVWIDDAKE